jgi:hypothetical protein
MKLYYITETTAINEGAQEISYESSSLPSKSDVDKNINSFSHVEIFMFIY